MRVLLIEDDAEARASLAELLGEAGIEVDGLANAEDALVLLGAGQVPDVLVTDIDLGPGLDGVGLAEMAQARHPDVGIVFISGDPQDAHGHRLGTHERFLQKPFRASELAAAIRDAAA